jgi:anti-anti-sigma factor
MATTADLFSVTSDPSGTLVLSGELDMLTCPKLDDVIRDYAGREGPILVDVSDLTFIDSTGIRALIQFSKNLASGGIQLQRAHGVVQKALEMAGVPSLRDFELRMNPPDAARQAADRGRLRQEKADGSLFRAMDTMRASRVRVDAARRTMDIKVKHSVGE